MAAVDWSAGCHPAPFWIRRRLLVPRLSISTMAHHQIIIAYSGLVAVDCSLCSTQDPSSTLDRIWACRRFTIGDSVSAETSVPGSQVTRLDLRRLVNLPVHSRVRCMPRVTPVVGSHRLGMAESSLSPIEASDLL